MLSIIQNIRKQRQNIFIWKLNEIASFCSIKHNKEILSAFLSLWILLRKHFGFQNGRQVEGNIRVK